MDGFTVDPAELTHAAGMINKAVAPADGLALDTAVDGCADAAGDDAVAGALTEFGAAWDLATEILRRRSQSTAEGLERAADSYAAHDEGARAALEGANHG